MAPARATKSRVGAFLERAAANGAADSPTHLIVVVAMLVLRQCLRGGVSNQEGRLLGS